MTIGFNCKYTFWYFLHIFCCKNFPENDEIKPKEENRNHRKDTSIFRLFFPYRSNYQFGKEKRNIEKDRNKEIKHNNICTEDPSSLSKKRLPTFESKCIVIKDVDTYLPDPVTTQSISNEVFDENEDENLKYPVSSDDDDSSISDVKSLKFLEQDFGQKSYCKDVIKVVSYSTDDNPNISMEAVPITSPLTFQDTILKNPRYDIHAPTYNESQIKLTKSHKSYQLPKCLYDDIKDIEAQTGLVKLEKQPQLSIAEEMNFQSTSFINQEIEYFPSYNEEKHPCYTSLKAEDLWEFNDTSMEESFERLEDPIWSNITEDETYNYNSSNKLSIIDKEQLKPKIRWLIPFEPLQLETHIHSAILHFFQAKQVSQVSIKKSLIIASKMLPSTFTDNMSIVAEAEVFEALESLEDTSNQRLYIDKRIIIHLVKEAFSDIYSFQIYFNQKPWIHPSMINRNNYSMWKGDKPPESFDLVNKIVWERINYHFIKKNMFLGDFAMTNQKNFSKIIKWCIERQKDPVDILLIDDLLKEENEWIYYDDAEEEIKIQIAEDIFHFLIIDTASWFRSIMSQNKDTLNFY